MIKKQITPWIAHNFYAIILNYCVALQFIFDLTLPLLHSFKTRTGKWSLEPIRTESSSSTSTDTKRTCSVPQKNWWKHRLVYKSYEGIRIINHFGGSWTPSPAGKSQVYIFAFTIKKINTAITFAAFLILAPGWHMTETEQN